MLYYSETSKNVYLAFNQRIGLTSKIFENLVHLTFNQGYKVENTFYAKYLKITLDFYSIYKQKVDFSMLLVFVNRRQGSFLDQVTGLR